MTPNPMKGLKFLLFAALALLASAAAAQFEEQIRERISPVGEVCVQGQQCAAGLQTSGGGSGESRDPEMIYMTYCQACHETGANDSPVRGEMAAWEERLEKDMETLYQNAIDGFNDGAMPPRGLCTNCSDEEIRATVDYLLEPVMSASNGGEGDSGNGENAEG